MNGQGQFPGYLVWFTDDGVVTEVPLRIGGVGAPGDMYGGRTLSFVDWGRRARVEVRPAAKPDYSGPDGIEHLIDAAKWAYIKMLGDAGEPIRVDAVQTIVSTTIPERKGLSGSSAPIIAYMACRLRLDGLDTDSRFRPEIMTEYALWAETGPCQRLAGRQDRAAQTKALAQAKIDGWRNCAIYADFTAEVFEANGGRYGNYKVLAGIELQPMALLISDEKKDSGAKHSTVHQRWLDGDAILHTQMRELAQLPIRAQEALLLGDWPALGRLMERSAEYRELMFTCEVLGLANLELRRIGHAAGCPTQYGGSGGSAVALLLDGDESLRRLQEEAGRSDKIEVLTVRHDCTDLQPSQ